MREDDNPGKLLWFLVGATVGATIALLYAPHSGEITRRKLGRKAQESREVLEESGRDVLDRGRDLYEKGRKIADDAADMFERGRKLVQG
ncbi:MAG: YtxH domain-containing protein [Bryobacteraceae bacterium]